MSKGAADVLVADAPCGDQAAAVFPPVHCANEPCGRESPSSGGGHGLELCLAASAPAKAGGSFTASDRRFEWGVPGSSAMQREDGAAVRGGMGTGMLELRGAPLPARSADFSPSSSSER